MKNRINKKCVLCGASPKDTHPCGDDYLCDRCCTNIMAIPDKLGWLFNWLDNIVLPYAIKQKKDKK